MDAERLIAKVEDISTPAPSVVKLLGLLNNQEVSSEAVVEVVRHDSVLSAKLLALANSAFFAPPRPVESCDEALFYLGYEQVHRLALAIGLGGVMNRKAAGYAMDEGEFWRHSFLTAKAAEFIATTSSAVDPALAFTAGLLHDIGKLVLNQFLDPASQAAVNRVIDERGQAGAAAERAVLHTDHAEVGAALLRKWAVPAAISDAVKFHHSDFTASNQTLAAIVALADGIAHTASAGASGIGPAIEAILLKLLNLDRSDYEAILGETSEALANLEAVSEIAGS